MWRRSQGTGLTLNGLARTLYLYPKEPLRGNTVLRIEEVWKMRALCRGLPSEWWFDAEEVETALSVCRACPVRAECAEYAEDFEEGEVMIYGIFGGETAYTRKRRREFERSF